MPASFTFRTISIAAMTACMVARGADLPLATNATPGVRISTAFATSSSLSVVLAADGHRDYLPRLRAVHALGKELSPEVVNALYTLLNRKAGEDPMPPEQLNAIKNDVVTALKKQTRPPVDLANNLAAMYRDPGHDVVCGTTAFSTLATGTRPSPTPTNRMRHVMSFGPPPRQRAAPFPARP